jgi:RNA polymerase II-associated factor 1
VVASFPFLIIRCALICTHDLLAIQASLHPPPVHPHDRPLLRPITALGRPKAPESSVSFLRRTEYISSVAPRRMDSTPKGFLGKRPDKRPAPDLDEASPQAIKKRIDASFAAADQNLRNLNKIKHPRNPSAKLVDAFPMLPDLDAFPDSGAYVTLKFLTNPVPSSSTFDTRLLSGLFKPIERTQAEEAAYDAAMEAWNRDPNNNPKPANLMNYDFYLPQTTLTADRFRAKFDVENPEHDDDELYTNKNESGPCFQFSRLRAYETAQEQELDHQTKYDEEIILWYNDDTHGISQKAVYYYPVMQRSTIRPQRTKNINRTTVGLVDEEEQVVDQLDITIEEPSGEGLEAMLKYKEMPYGFEVEAEAAEENAGANGASQGDKGASAGRTSQSPSEEDAEGEEDEEE